jgi:sugar phosphate isomerase/epimerase
MQIRHVVELAELARDLGGDKVRVFTGYENPAASYGVQMKLVVDSLRECARRSAEFGVTIGVQNHHDLACGFEAMHDLIGAVCEPNCRAMFDAWAPALHGVDIQAAARAMGSLTVHTTIADYQLRPRYIYEPAIVNYRSVTPAVQAVRMGEGFIDYAAFLSALSENGFRGSVAYEMCSPLRDGGSVETLDAYARSFLEYLNRSR